MLDSNKSIDFNKKSHFKVFVYVSYDTYNFMIRYDSYNTHVVSYNLWALTIRRYDIKLFTHDVSYHTDNYTLEYDLIANVYVSLELDTFSLISNNLIHQNNFFLIEKKGKL